MRTIRLSLSIVSILSLYHPLPSFPPALVTYASFPISLLRIITPLFFPRLFRSRMLFQSHSLTLATHSRVGSGTRVSYEHSTRGNHYVARERGFSFELSSKRTTSAGKPRAPFVEKSLPSASTRVALRKIKIPLDQSGRHGEKLLRSHGTR